MKNKGLVFSFAIASLIVLVLIGNYFFADKVKVGGMVIGEQNLMSNLLIPSTITSIVLSVIGIVTIAYLVMLIRKKGIGRSFPFKGYVASISIVFVIYVINYFITLFPYGNFSLVFITIILQIMTYGILLPYILVAQICYILLLLRGDVRDILK